MNTVNIEYKELIIATSSQKITLSNKDYKYYEIHGKLPESIEHDILQELCSNVVMQAVDSYEYKIEKI